MVRLGEYILSRTDEIEHEDYAIAERIIHPEYNENFRNDIAILVLEGEVNFKSKIDDMIGLISVRLLTQLLK